MKSISERVAAGMRFLDARDPGWLDKVDANTLDVGSCDLCVLGQIYGHYNLGLYELKVRSEVTLGFASDDEDEYAELTKSWKRAICSLRETKRAVAPNRATAKRGVPLPAFVNLKRDYQDRANRACAG